MTSTPRPRRWLPAVVIATLVVTIGAAVAGNTFTDGADQPHNDYTTVVTG